MDTLPNAHLLFVNNLICYLMNTVTVMLKKEKKIVWGKWYKSSCPPSNRVENGPTMWCVCWYFTQKNQFDRTLVGRKNHSKAVRCQSEGWPCLAKSTSVVISWFLLRPTRLNPTSHWDTVTYVPRTPGPQTACLTPGLETSSTVLLPIVPLTPPGVCLSAPSSAALREGAGPPSLLLAALLQCRMPEQELCDNNSPSEGKPQDPLSVL